MNWIERVAKILKDKVVLDVGGQFPVKGHINMDAYALKADITTLNNKISALEAQLSVGGLNLINRTGELENTILNSSGEVQKNYGNVNLMKNLISVVPGETLKCHASTFTGAIEFRINEYGADGTYINHWGSSAVDDEFAVPENVYYLWVSYPAIGEVSITRPSPYNEINAKITGGTTE